MTTSTIDPSRDASSENVGDFASLFVSEVRIRDFRGLGDCRMSFEPELTLLVGRNNAGKSRVLRALALALGATIADRDDLTIGGAKTATIDVVLAPWPSNGKAEIFDTRTMRRLADIQPLSEDPPRERFAWRTTIRHSQAGWGVISDNAVLVFDHSASDWRLPEPSTALTADQRSIVAADLVETGRDLVEELAHPGSPIRRVLDDLEIPPQRRGQLEGALQTLSDELMSSSASLASLKAALAVMSQAVDSMGEPSLTALPVRLEELARTVSINLDTGRGRLPIRFHGAGARSLASLQVQSVLYARRLGRDGPALRPHPVTLIEEPEAHLHPQAQFELPALFAHAQGQIIASTHSAHLVSVAEFRSIRILQGAEGETKVIDLLPVADGATTPARGRHSPDELVEMEKLRRLIERPFGELLFASAVIMGDGATERALLPPLIREALQSRGDGVCVVDPGSMASDLAIAVVNFAKRVGIPWLLFSDSDPAGEAAAMRLIADHGDGDMNRVIWVRLQASSRGWATERMFMDFSQDLCESACRRLGFSGDASRLFKFMMRRKGVLGNLLAEELISRHPWPEDPALQMECWPPPICQLISKLDNALPERSVLP